LNGKLLKQQSESETHLKNAPTARGIASRINVRVLPNLSAKAPPVKEPTVAPARVVLTTHPEKEADAL
jgi:hypothetical protein